MATGVVVVPAKYGGRVKSPIVGCKCCFDTGLVIFGEDQILGAKELLRRSTACTCSQGDQWKTQYKTFAMIDLLCSERETGARLDAGTIAALRALPIAWARELEEHMKALDYSTFLNTNYWAVIRSYYISKAGGKCQNCPETIRKNLSVHHKSYAVIGAEWKESNEWALRCLCHVCHHAEHEIVRGLEKAQPLHEPTEDLKAAFEKLLDKCSMNGGQHKLHVPRSMKK